MKQKSDGWNSFRRVGIPEVNAAIARVQDQEREGVFQRPPKTEKQIRSVEDLCRYIFKKVHQDGSYQVRFVNEHVRTWVWNGYDYTDKVVDLVERIADQLTDKGSLEELRIVATKVSAKGVERLRKVFSLARVFVFTDEESEANWRWSQAHYNGQTNNALEDQAREEARRRPMS